MKRLTLGLLVGVLAFAPTIRAEEKKIEKETFQVPYRLTIPKHILVRAKINGKGPYNFILDTGAPALFVATKVAKEIGVKPDRNSWGTFDRFEVEGGVVFEKAKGRIEDPFQLKGMNGLGLAGAELHGVIGYNLLAQYRMTFDFTQSKMEWSKLDWTPKAPLGLGGRARSGGQGGLEIVGTIMQALGTFMGRKATPDYKAQGYLGVEVEEKDGAVLITNVVEDSPAEKAGLKVGDQFRKFNRRSVYGLDGLQTFMKKVTAGEEIKLRMLRGKEKESVEITLTAGKGL